MDLGNQLGDFGYGIVGADSGEFGSMIVFLYVVVAFLVGCYFMVYPRFILP